MTLHIDTITIDCRDEHEQARFWAAALGWEMVVDSDGDRMIVPTSDNSAATPGAFPVLFQEVPEPKVGKNRHHFDLAPDDQDAEVARLEQLGATRVDIGQKDVSWIVMADPEGNEFCVLSSRPT